MVTLRRKPDKPVWWKVISLLPDGRRCVSAAIGTRDEAVKWAQELRMVGLTVVSIVGSDGEEVSMETVSLDDAPPRRPRSS